MTDEIDFSEGLGIPDEKEFSNLDLPSDEVLRSSLEEKLGKTTDIKGVIGRFFGHLKQGNIEDAIRVVDAAEVGDQKWLKNQLYALAEFKREHFGEALNHISSSLQQGAPDIAHIYLLQGHCHTVFRNFGAAVKSFAKLLELEPDNKFAWHLHGFALHYNDEPDKAITSLTRALQLDPTDSNSYAIRGKSFAERKEFERAISDFREALKSDPDDQFVLHDLGYSLEHSGHVDEAIQIYETLLKREPENVRLHQDLGTSFARKKQYAEALKVFQRAYELDPNGADTLDHLGFTNLRLNNPVAAREWYEKGVRIAPERARLWYGYGIALGRIQELDNSIDAFDRALDINPQFNTGLCKLSGSLVDCLNVWDKTLKEFTDEGAPEAELAEAKKENERYLGLVKKTYGVLKKYGLQPEGYSDELIARLEK